jgi:signal peptidase I
MWVILVVTCAIAALLLVLLRLRATYSVICVDGHSMAPVLNDGDRLLVRRAAAAGLRRGQIAVVRSPDSIGGTFLVKRIAALPGDPVPPSVAAVVAGARIPAGDVVLLSDNSEDSFDSRDHGCFPLADVHAVALRKLPLKPVSGSAKETA